MPGHSDARAETLTLEVNGRVELSGSSEGGSILMGELEGLSIPRERKNGVYTGGRKKQNQIEVAGHNAVYIDGPKGKRKNHVPAPNDPNSLWVGSRTEPTPTIHPFAHML